MATLGILASGMVTAVGFNAPASLAAIRAGIRNVNQTNLWHAESGTHLAAGKVPLPQWWVGLGKLADLAAPAILECLEAARPVSPEAIPVLLGVAPADRPFRLAELDAEILPEIGRRLEFRLHPASRVVPRDHVSVVVALREAAEIIARKQAPCVIVAAVDSLLEHDLKNHYISLRRLLAPKNSNGFSLGEAGSAVLVVPPSTATQPVLQILGMGLARESATIESEEPLRAKGLLEAIRAAFQDAGLTIEAVQYRITDLNGEHYKFKEMTLAMGRLLRKPKPKLFDLWHPIEYIGDVGAAIGPLVLAVALHAGQKGYGVGPTVLCTFGNDDGERAAIVVQYPSEASQR
jgi:3-oxoacyl-[acyl-carrier-protein] synthase-1